MKSSHSHHGFILEVEDTGVGFTAEQSTHLFERFYRSEQVRGKFAGNGLGLSVAKAILDHYGGTVAAESNGTAQGATFSVHVPVAKHVLTS